MRYLSAIIASLLTASLLGCNDDDVSTDTGTPSIPTMSLSGKAADGYLEAAEVCLDLNLNMVCDSGEPTAMTGSKGTFTLQATQENIDTYPIIVNVIAGKTTDTDNPGIAITKEYTLSAPAKSDFVSPITTLIQNEIENGNTSDDAIATVQQMLGTDQDITKDYIEEKNDASLSNEEKAAFEQIHKVAQVTTRVMAAKLEELENSAAQKGISSKELQSVITEEVSNVISDINAQITIDENFDPDNVANTIKDSINLSPDNLEDMVDSNNADKKPVQANLELILEEEALVWFDSASENGKAILKVGASGIIDTEQNTVLEELIRLNDDYTGVIAIEDTPAIDLLLTEKGWIIADDEIVSFESNADGSGIFVTKTPELSISAKVNKIDVSGLKVANVLAKTADDSKAWSGLYAKSTTMPEGAVAYNLKTSLVSPDHFKLYSGDWCGDAADSRGGICNGVQEGSEAGALSYVQSLDQIVKVASSNDPQGTVILGQVGADALVGELLVDGKVNFFIWRYHGLLEESFASGTWEDITVHGKVIRKVIAPPKVHNVDGLTWHNFANDNNAYLTVVNDFVRVLASPSVEMSEEYMFGVETFTTLMGLITEPITLAQCLSSLPDAGYEARVGDYIEYDVNRVEVNSEDIIKYVERITYKGSNHTWFPEYSAIAGIPEWVTATAGSVKKEYFERFDSTGAEVIATEESYSSVQYGFHGWYSQWYSMMVTPKELARPASEYLINWPISIEHERVNFTLLDKALANNTPYPLIEGKTKFIFENKFLGKETVQVPASDTPMEACVVFEDFGFGTTKLWHTNRGVIKRVNSEPEYVTLYERLATQLPPLN